MVKKVLLYLLSWCPCYPVSLLHLLVSTHAVMGQFSGPYSPVAKLFCDLSPTIRNFIARKKFKFFFTLNCALNLRCVRNLMPFHMDRNRS